MTQEEKELLLKDLCARLSYGVICDRLGKPKKLLGVHPTKKFPLEFDNGEYMPSNYRLEDIKPYLHPMSSMTEEEKKYISNKCGFSISGPIGGERVLIMPVLAADWLIDFYNEHHIDYHGLIEKGLALEAPKDMYGKIMSKRL